MPVQRDISCTSAGAEGETSGVAVDGEDEENQNTNMREECGRDTAETSSGWTLQGLRLSPPCTAMFRAGFAPSCLPHLRVTLRERWLPWDTEQGIGGDLGTPVGGLSQSLQGKW